MTTTGGVSDSDLDSSGATIREYSSEERAETFRTRASVVDDQTQTRQRLLAYRKEGEAWEWIFGKFLRQDSACNICALEHGPVQRRLGFLAQVDVRQLNLCVSTCPLASTRMND